MKNILIKKISKTISIVLILVVFYFFIFSANAYASTIVSDTFQNGYNTSIWTIYPGQAAPIPSNFGISIDPQHSSEYSTLVHVGLPSSERVIMFDVKINNNTSSDFGIFINDGGSNWKNAYLFGSYGNGGIPHSFVLRESNASWNLTGSWDESLGIHHFEIDFSDLNQNITLKEDNITLGSWTSAYNFPASNLWLSMYGLGSEFANFLVCDAAGCDPTPTPTTTPSPTPTPTPEVNLNVPLIKQTDNPWQSQEYDTAHLWAPSNPTIHDWGCALTSATMVLQYNGITKLPNNAELNPGALNAWLKTQPDGYIEDGSEHGLVNWLAISRLSRLIKLAFNNPNYTADALEWKWLKNNSAAQLAQDLHNNIPDILNEPGHFVVAKGTQGTTFTINDPAFNKTLLTDYGNTFAYAGQFVPSHTDLSYLLLVGPQDLLFDMKTATGSGIGDSFIQQPMTNDANPSQTNGLPIKIFYVQHPANDSYHLTITSPNSQVYDIKAFAYDLQGNVATSDIQGSVDNTHPNTLTVPFDKTQNINGQIKKQITIPLLLFDLQTLYGQNLIKKIPYTVLLHVFTDIQKAANKNKLWEEKILLRVASMLLKVEKPFGISDQAYALLNADLSSLQSMLPRATPGQHETEEDR